VGALRGAGLSHEEAAYYNEGVKRGGTLLAARVAEERADEIAQVLSSDGAVNINERAEQYRQEGFVPPAATIESVSPAATMGAATDSTPSAPPSVMKRDTRPHTPPIEPLAEVTPPASAVSPPPE